MATIVLYERDQTIFAGSIKTRHTHPLLFLSTKREARPSPEALGPQNVPERSTACQLFSQRDLGYIRALIGESMTKHKDNPIFLSVRSS